ncbi:MAG: serine/threonine protein kinase, partial [Frankia sp.]|nr:serine/threonine protein kinase [Frankia sp.]
MIIDRGRVAAALPDYELGDELGQGAYGLVLGGHHRGLGREVAIKVLRVDPRDVENSGGMDEARLLASLDHPHIVRVLHATMSGELHLIVMELLAGGTLLDRCRESPVSPQAACAVALAVADALHHAHGAGALHRDIKPANIMFDQAGQPKVTDFGIAKLLATTSTTASSVIGTPRYMAPEQLSGGRLSPATDIYALGVMLYELLAGTPPFDPALAAYALIHHHLYVDPSAPANVETQLADVVMWALAKDPANRPASAQAFALALASAAAEVFPAGWLVGSGVRLQIDEDVRAVAEGRPSTKPIPTP